jgi:hypothetical protein
MRPTLWNQLYISILFKVEKLKHKLLLAFHNPVFLLNFKQKQQYELISFNKFSPLFNFKRI